MAALAIFDCGIAAKIPCGVVARNPACPKMDVGYKASFILDV
jgi:hypothetical protein